EGVEPITGMEVVWVPGGCYEMGCGEWAGDCWENEEAVHEVCVDGFWIGKFEVTGGQWRTLMPDRLILKYGDDDPVVWISWDQVQRFIMLLDLATVYRYDFRLPTNAEWEYACRSGGRAETYAGGDDVDALAWNGWNSEMMQPNQVGAKIPNGLGLYDMSGNVWELVEQSNYAFAQDESERSTSTDSSEYPENEKRGGSFLFSGNASRCSCRIIAPQDYGQIDTGFRVVRND
ncbi:MAG: formylglycine-generating enzyme family protein, partial [Desulfovibrio sp.]